MELIENMLSEKYHASPGVSVSRLKHYRTSPAHGKADEDGLIQIGKTVRLFGQAFHSRILEPETWDNLYVVKPKDMNFVSKGGKEWRDSQTTQIVSFDDFEAMDGMAKAAQAHPVAGPFLRTKGRCELSCFDTHPETGLPIRARFDKLTSEHVIVDVKTTVSAKPFDFVRQCAYLGYFIQAAFYMDMLTRAKLPCEGFVFIAIEKEPPYAVLCAEFDAISIAKGRSEYERLLKLYKKCHDEQKWPGYYDSAAPYMMTLPTWCLESEELPDQVPYVLEAA